MAIEELDILKRDWHKSESGYKTYSDSELKPMLQKGSTSIVKTLFYISIGELVFWIMVNYLPYALSDKYRSELDRNYENPWFLALSILNFLVLLAFVYLLFKSHKAISSTDNTKKLMERILTTRRVIKYYVIYNLAVIFVSVPLVLYMEFNENIKFHDDIEAMNNSELITMLAVVIVMMLVFVAVFWGIYSLLYGILLKRLHKNYKELKKLEL